MAARPLSPSCRVAPHLSAQASAATYLRPNRLCILEVRRLHKGNVSGSEKVCSYQLRAVPSSLIKSSAARWTSTGHGAGLYVLWQGAQKSGNLHTSPRCRYFRGQCAAYHVTTRTDSKQLQALRVLISFSSPCIMIFLDCSSKARVCPRQHG